MIKTTKILFIFIIFLIVPLYNIAQQSHNLPILLHWTNKPEETNLRRMSIESVIPSNYDQQLPAYFIDIPIGNSEQIHLKLDSIKEEIINTTSDNSITSKIAKNYRYNISYLYTRGKKIAHITIEIFRKGAHSSLYRLNQFDIHYSLVKKKSIIKSKGRVYASHSVLSQGQWYKISTNRNGIYKVTGSNLEAMGFSLSGLTINSIRLYGNGGGMLAEANSVFRYDDLVENSIKVYDNNSNGFFDTDDYFLFYGTSSTKWLYNKQLKAFTHTKDLYDDYAYYFITLSGGQGKRITPDTNNYGSANIHINSFTDYAFHDNDSLNLIKTGREWYGEQFNVINTYNFKFNFSSIDASKKTRVRTNAIARSTLNSRLVYHINGHNKALLFSAVSSNYLAPYAEINTDTINFKTSNSAINVQISYNKPNSSAQAWLNYIEVNAPRHLTMTGEQLTFRSPQSVGTGNIAEYTLKATNANTIVWDISNPLNPIKMNITLSGNNINFKSKATTLKTFVAFNGGYYTPGLVGNVANQDLHSLSKIDYVILYNKKFKKQAETLANYHRTYNHLNVYTTEASTIYNEFSSGAKDITAIRDFMKMLYDKAAGNISNMPKYLLLFGDGSYDYKNRIPNNTNLVLTYESKNSLSPTTSFCTDDYFGLLDDNEGANANGRLDIGIGRFPVTTTGQADAIINKILRYKLPQKYLQNNPSCNAAGNKVKAMADWRNITCFIGDDEDGDLHTAQANYLANYVWNNYPDYNVDKIFFDAYHQIITPGGQRYPQVTKAINQRVAQGALIINYTGHGGELGWAHESVLEVKDINAWKNYNNLPLFVTATCEFSRYDDPQRISAGEYVLLNPIGGGIALLTTSRVTYSSTNFALSKVIYRNILKKQNGKYPTLGEIIRLSKIGAGSVSANKNFVLLGDPAMRLVYPYDKVTTTAVIDAMTGNKVDTIKALQKVIIKGEVQKGGQLLSNFNGILYPTIYDKSQTYTTLGNDPGSPIYNFKLQNNIIYKGKARITNGQFEFTFVVPKDIAYRYGFGKISYYASNDSMDANGYLDTINIGGSYDMAESDNTGPSIKLFLNDTNFQDGGITDENPKLLSFIFDKNGINTVGNGIGHDITAILDENSAQSIILNDYYQANLNNYQRGSIRYPFYNLAVGNHTLSLKVWDVYNNSSSASINFLVANNTDFVVDNMLNAPNPFTNTTSIIFDHNQACDLLQVQVLIYNIRGQLVRELKATVNASGYRVGPNQLVWDGTNNGGQALSQGVYIYTLRIQNSNGTYTEKSNKMVLMK